MANERLVIGGDIMAPLHLARNRQIRGVDLQCDVSLKNDLPGMTHRSNSYLYSFPKLCIGISPIAFIGCASVSFSLGNGARKSDAVPLVAVLHGIAFVMEAVPGVSEDAASVNRLGCDPTPIVSLPQGVAVKRVYLIQ